uniref:Uncharacterized protein n=1 Tax=Aegilops tauschii subsp. strangulata TaxID=200361 RepID=A0A453QKH6_AEGTS
LFPLSTKLHCIRPLAMGTNHTITIGYAKSQLSSFLSLAPKFPRMFSFQGGKVRLFMGVLGIIGNVKKKCLQNCQLSIEGQKKFEVTYICFQGSN